jgi:hypothetical protein
MSLLAHYRGNVIQGGMRMGKEHPIGKEGLSFACQMVGTFDWFCGRTYCWMYCAETHEQHYEGEWGGEEQQWPQGLAKEMANCKKKHEHAGGISLNLETNNRK